MKSIRIILLSSFIGLSCLAQEKKYLKSDDVPNLLLNDFLPERLIVKDQTISDSLKVVFNISVNFEYPLYDTAKCINVKSVEIFYLSIFSLNTGENIINTKYENELGTPYQQYLWHLCAERLNYWYCNQPYKKMDINKITGEISDNSDTIYFAGSFFIEPLEDM